MKGTSRLLATAAAVVGVAMTAGCGDDTTVETAATLGERTTLSEVAEACDDGDPTEPGVIEVTGELRGSNTTVNLEDCVVHLGSGADVTLNNVTVTGGILNLHDRDTDRARNVVRLQRVTFDSRAVLIELNDADDEFRAERLEATVAEGWSLQVAETDDDANEGGSVRLVSSTVLATGTDAPVTVTASEHSGTVELVNTTLDTRGLLLVTAADCSARIRGNALDCSTDALVADVAGP